MDWLTARLIGLTYQAYNLTGAYYDPAAELGDTLISRSDIQSAILTERVAFNVAWRAEIGAPEVGEVEDEYPYIGQTAQTARQLRRLNEIIADRATVEELEAVIARINNLSVDDIRAGVIHSADYQTGAAALVYPDSGTYPGTDVYPSAGETVTKGFAIDFSSGQIYGAFYSEQIASLDARVTALENR